MTRYVRNRFTFRQSAGFVKKSVGKQQIRSGISHYLEDTDHGPKVNDHLILRGGVESDPDGREIAWDELGRMVAAFEGW